MKKMNATEILKYISVENPWIGLIIVMIGITAFLAIKRYKIKKKISLKKNPQEQAKTNFKMPPTDLNFDFDEQLEAPEPPRNQSADFVSRAGRINNDISYTMEKLLKELKQIEVLKDEIRTKGKEMKIIYNDLSNKEKILRLTIQGLDGRVGRTPSNPRTGRNEQEEL